MKSFGISSLFVGCLMFSLLDMAPSPSGCHDRHPYNNRYIKGTIAVTGEDIIVGDTWAEVNGKAYPENIPAYCELNDYGIEYKEGDGSQSGYAKISAMASNEVAFTIRIEGLKPNTSIFSTHTLTAPTMNFTLEQTVRL